ncbi:MAG TPA: M48 family metalloprotease [Telluria sp.]|nr:M48 family metalloprotease [Telluria sp.]
MVPHRIVFALVASLSLACAQARAFTQDEVLAGAEKTYRTRITTLSQAGMLDRDSAFLARVERILQRLAEQARRDDPGSPIRWEIHTCSDSDDNASAMAGGKLLLSQAYAERLSLTDAELAMVLSHEMQHVLLLHNVKEYEEALRLDPAWRDKPFSELEDAVDNNTGLMTKLSPLNWDQEVEADRAGLAMAWRAGWRARELAGYFRKLEQATSMSHFGSNTHPSPLLRWRTARTQAAALDANRTLP